MEKVKGVTYFELMEDEKGWKAVKILNGKVLKSVYGLNGTKDEAEENLNYMKNEFWGFKLN